VDYDISPLTF